MTLQRDGRSRRKVKKKGDKRVLRAYALAAAGMLCGVLVFAACGEEYTRISTEVEHFTLQTVALEAGSSHTFDLEEFFRKADWRSKNMPSRAGKIKITPSAGIRSPRGARESVR